MTVIPASVKCDECDKDRADDYNHWLSIVINEGPRQAITFIEGAHHDLSSHVCGAACASRVLARWLSTGTLDEK